MREGGCGSGGRERVRKERRHGRIVGKRGGGSERSVGEDKGRSVGGREIGREGNIKRGTLMRTLASIQYTAVSTQNNTQPGPL